MICTLSVSQQEKFFAKVAKDLLDRSASADPFNIKDYIKEIHTMVLEASKNNEDLASTYAQLVPSYIEEISAFDRNIKRAFKDKGLDYDEIFDLVEAFENEETGLASVKAFVAEEVITPEIATVDLQAAQAQSNAETQQKIEEDKAEDIDKAVKVIENPQPLPKKPSTFVAVKSTAMADRDQEAIEWKDPKSPNYNVVDPVNKFFFKVKRIMRDMLAAVKNDPTKVIVGRTAGVKLTLMHIQNLPIEEVGERGRKSYKSFDGVEGSLYDRNTPVMVLTDGEGNILKFNPETGLPDENGMPSYYSFREIYNQQINKDADGKITIDLWKSATGLMDDHEMVRSLARQEKISETEATKKVRKQLQQIYEIREALKKDPSLRIPMDITSVTEGYIEYDLAVNTPVAQLKNVPSFQYAPFADSISGVKKGEIYFTTPDTGDRGIILERPSMNTIPGLVEKVSSLLFDELTIGKLPMAAYSRQSFVEPYLFLTQKDSTGMNIDMFINPETGNYTVSLNGKGIFDSTTATPETRIAAKKLVSDTANMVQIQGVVDVEKHPNAAVYKGTDFSEFQNIMKNGDIFIHLTTDKNNNSVETAYWVGLPKAQVTKDNLNGVYDDAEIAQDGSVTKVEKDYRRDYIGPHFTIHYPLNSDNELMAMNPYFTYSYPKTSQDKVNKALGKTIEGTPEKVIPKLPVRKADVGKRGIEAALDNPDLLNKLFGQKSRESDAVKEKVEAAITWYTGLTGKEYLEFQDLQLKGIGRTTAESKRFDQINTKFKESGHALSKAIPLTVLFEAVNTANEKSVATWTRQGITLYKGADFSDIYHEAWHGFTQSFLTKDQKDALYNEARKQPGSFTDYKGHRVSFKSATPLQLEEYMAEEFRTYMLNGKAPQAPVKKSIFQKILDYLKALFEGVSVAEVSASDSATRNLHEIFEKLRIGNIAEYNFEEANAKFSVLNKGVIAYNKDTTLQELSYDDSKEIVEIVDSLFSEFIDEFSKGARRKMGTDSTKWTSTLLQKPGALKNAYEHVQERLAEAIEDLTTLYEKYIADGETFKADSLLRKLNLFDWAYHEFGDVDNLLNNRPTKGEDVKGLIGYHQLKSKILHKEAKEAFFDEDVLDEADLFKKGREGYDKAGNETSLKDQAAEEILFLINGLHKTDNLGNKIYIEGTTIPILESFDRVWNRIVKTLENTLDATVMYSKLFQLSEKSKDLPIKQLLEKLGDVRYAESKTSAEFNLWTNFWQTFNKARVPLLQTTVEIETLDKDDKHYAFENMVFNVNPGRATSDIKKIKNRWDSLFISGEGSAKAYQKKDQRGRRFLDLEKVFTEFMKNKEWRDIVKNNDEIRFLRAVGFDFDEGNPDIEKAIGEVNPEMWFSRLKHLSFRTDAQGNRFAVRLYKLSDIALDFKETDLFKSRFVEVDGRKVMQDQGDLNGKSSALANEGGNFNKILEAQARFSDQWGNFQVSNAEGNTQFEHTLNNTLTVMVNAINEAENYRDLISKPWMRHLDIRFNPHAKISTWLNSMFDMTDVKNGGIGPKRKTNKGEFVKLNMENLSGVAIKRDGVFEDDLGIASASADPVTKLIMDFHMSIVKGSPELMRHADKGTSFSIYLSNIYSKAGTGLMYVNTESFYEKQETASKGENDAIDVYLVPNLEAEIARIIKVRDINTKIAQIVNNNKDKSTEEVDKMIFDTFGYLDKKYLKAGTTFTAFSDVLSPSTKRAIYKGIIGLQGGEYKVKETVYDAVKADMLNYFKAQSSEVKSLFNKASRKGNPLISDNAYQKLYSKLRLSGTITLEDFKRNRKAQDAMIKSFVYNSWIHNIESVNVIYGDLAQYNMAKEEFHKRNAGASSTGTLYRSDAAAIAYVNNKLGRRYAESLGIKTQHLAENGILNTAVVKDNEIPSAYLSSYADSMIADLKSKMSEDKAIKKVMGYDAKADLAKKIYKPVKGGLVHAYYEMNEGDAQGWLSFDTYRILLNLEGKWSDSQESLYQDIIAGKYVKPGTVLQTFPPQKLQHWGPLANTDLGLNAFHKYSLFPLVPNVIQNTTLDELHLKMMKENVDYVVFQSGSKVGTLTKNSGMDKLYSDDVRTLATPEFAKNQIFLNFLKNQLEVAPKFKEKVIFSTQLRKLVEDGLIENGVPTDFMEQDTADKRIAAWDRLSSKEKEKKSANYKLYKAYENNINKLTLLKKKELLDEMNWTLDENGEPTGKLNTLVKFLKDELSTEELAEHELQFIDLKNGGEELKHDLSLSLSAEKIERMLNSIVVRRLVKQKVNGEGLIQISGAGMENKAAWLGARNATAEELKQWGTNDLPTYHNTGPGGKTTAMKVKIAMQGKFKNLLHMVDKEGKRIRTIERLNDLLKDEEWLNTGDNRQMVTMVGVRIPVQGLNSMEFMEVYQFLPENAGNIIIPPAEIVAKSGSDFDIDKLSVFMPSIANIDGETFLVKHDPSVKESKTELKSKLLELRQQKDTLDAIKEDDFEKAKETKAFKILTDSDKLMLERVRDENIARTKEIRKNIRSLEATWKELSKRYVRNVYTPAGYNETEAALMKEYAIMEETKREYNDLRKQYKDVFFDTKLKDFNKLYDQKIKPVDEEINSIKRKLLGVGTEGVENDILWNLREILELPANYVNLITPNSTDTVKPLADHLADQLGGYKPKNRVNPLSDTDAAEFGEDHKSISGTRVLEIGYNLYKHASNNIGKQVLGLGAIDNTFNAVFNRIGAYMEPSLILKDSIGKEIVIPQTLKLPHNTINTDRGQAISLSDLWEKGKETRISDVISQLMNGWVDIAKDAWIFNVQGNKELAPILLFLVQAGVPFETAVYFISQPIIREYAEEQRNVKSSFGELLGKENNPKAFRAKSLEYVMNNHNFRKKFKLKGGDDIVGLTTLHAASQEAMAKIGMTNGFDLKTLKDQIEGQTTSEDIQEAVFLHFLEIQNMSDSVRDVKMAMNFDTNKSATVFEALNKSTLVNALSDNKRISSNMASRILEDSPIGSFYVQPFQVKVWKDLFPIRNHEAVNDFMQELMESPDYRSDIRNTFGDEVTFGNTLRNDLVSFIFQNALRHFNIDELDHYKGGRMYDMDKLSKKESTPYLSIGAFVKDGAIYVDKRTINDQYQQSAYSTEAYTKLGLVKVDRGTFSSLAEYQHFVLEREHLRALYMDNADLKSSFDYKMQFEAIYQGTQRKQGESEEQFLDRISRITFERFITNRALHNIFNPVSLFKGSMSFADRFLNIKTKFPMLEKDYAIIGKLMANSVEISKNKTIQEYTNLILSEKLEDTDLMNLLHENLLKLADRHEQKVENPVDNLIISDFFAQLPLVAFIQSGMNTRSSFSITRVMPTDSFIRTIEKDAKVYQDKLSTDLLANAFYPHFLKENAISRGRLRNRFKDFFVPEVHIEKNHIAYENRKKGFSTFSANALQEPIKKIEVENIGSKIMDAAVLPDGSTVAVIAETYYAAPFTAYLLENEKELVDAVKKEVGKTKLNNALDSSSSIKMFMTIYADSLVKNDIIASALLEEIPMPEVTFDYRVTAFIDAIGKLQKIKEENVSNALLSVDQNGTILFAAKDLNIKNTESLVNGNPDKIFVFNDAPGEKGFSANSSGAVSDRLLKALPVKTNNVIGLPTYNTYFLSQGTIITDENGAIRPLIKERIDAALNSIQESGLTPAFSKAGYGQEMIGESSLGQELSFLKASPAPQTFLYLSKELYNRFGYVNKGFLINPATKEEAVSLLQFEARVSDNDVEEFIKKCK